MDYDEHHHQHEQKPALESYRELFEFRLSLFFEVLGEQKDLLEEYRKQLELLKKDNAELLREILAYRERGFFPYGPIGF